MKFQVMYFNGLGEVDILNVEVFKAAYDNTAWSGNDIDEVSGNGRVFRNLDDAVDHVDNVCYNRNYTYDFV